MSPDSLLAAAALLKGPRGIHKGEHRHYAKSMPPLVPPFLTPRVPPFSRYISQLARTRRSLGRIASRTATSEQAMLDGLDEYQGNVLAFFMNCWHVKDWIKNDDGIEPLVRQQVVRAAEASATLQVCRALANGAKHMELRKNEPADRGRAKLAMYTFKHLHDGTLQREYLIKRDDGSYVGVYEVGCAAMQEWRRILDEHQLPLPSGWSDP
jgi:hypothetical protein